MDRVRPWAGRAANSGLLVLWFLSPHPPEVSGPGKPGLQWSTVDLSLKEQLQKSARGDDKLMAELLADSHTSTREGAS